MWRWATGMWSGEGCAFKTLRRDACLLQLSLPCAVCPPDLAFAHTACGCRLHFPSPHGAICLAFHLSHCAINGEDDLHFARFHAT